MNLERNSLHLPCNSLPLIVEANTETVRKPHIHQDRTADFNVLIYVIRGSMEIIEDDKLYLLEKGNLFILKNGVHHYGKKSFAYNTKWHYIHFYSEPILDAKPMENEFLGSGNRYLTKESYNRYITLPKLLTVSDESEIAVKFAEIIDMYNQSTGFEAIQANLLFFKFLLYCCTYNKQPKQVSLRESHIQKITSFISQNYCSNFSAKEVEDFTNLSYKYAGAVFKEATGLTIKNYQLKMRIEKAEKMLSNTYKALGEIAYELGFCDAFYFSTVFKREKGISPSAYRKKMHAIM